MQTQIGKSIIIDAKDLILGRMAAVVAKRLLQGECVTILNAEKAVVSGRRRSRIREAKRKLEIGHPRKGPFHQRQPDRFVRRTVRGMLPRKKPKGKEAMKRLRVFIGTPKEFEEHQTESVNEARAEKLKCSYTTVGEIVRELGSTPAR